MVKYCTKLAELNFDKLMQIYAEAIEENGREFYPNVDRFESILRARDDFYQYLREVFFPVRGAFYAILVEDGVYMSALRMEPYRDGLLLEAVETAPQYRKKGYATVLLKHVLGSLGRSRVYSHVSKNNLASIRLHTSCGFEKVSDSAAYIDGSVSTRACTFCFSSDCTKIPDARSDDRKG